MSKILFFCLGFLLFSCHERQKSRAFNKESVSDSTVYYFNVSKRKELTLEEKKYAINKSLSFSKQPYNDSLLSKILYRKSFLHLSMNEFDSLIEFNETLIGDAKKRGDKLLLGKQHYLLGYYFDEIVHDSDSAFQYYNLSKNYFHEINDSSRIGKNLLSMGLLQQNRNDFFGSKETLTEALQYLEAVLK